MYMWGTLTQDMSIDVIYMDWYSSKCYLCRCTDYVMLTLVLHFPNFISWVKKEANLCDLYGTCVV